MRVLLAFEPPAGGVPEHVLRLSLGLAEREHEVTVTGPPDARPRASLEAAGISYVELPWRGGVPAPRADLSVLRGLAALLRDGRFALAHAHGQKAGLLVRAAAPRCGVPALYSPHGFVYRTQLLRPRRARRLRRRVNLALERGMGRRTALLVACAEDEARAAVRDALLPAERVRVVSHGVAPDLQTPPDPVLASFRGEGPLFGLVATLRDQKGLPTLLDALDLLAAQGRPVRLAIVGDGPLRDLVTKRIGSGPLSQTTLHRPFGGRVEPYLAALDVFVLPSLWEGLSIAVLEAMAMGLPVVASRVNGTPEAVDDGRTGILVPSSDPQALARALISLAEDGKLRRRLGEAARDEVERRFTMEQMVEGMEARYREVVGAGGA